MPTIEIYIAATGGVLLTAFLAYGLVAAGENADDSSLSARDRAERRRDVAGSFIYFILFATGIAKFAGHAGWLAPGSREVIFHVVGVPLVIAAVAYLKAWWDVKRATPEPASVAIGKI